MEVQKETVDVDDIDDDENILLQDIMDDPGKDPLKVKSNFEFSRQFNEDQVNMLTGVKIKSGKYAKSSNRIVKQETWPHNAVSRRYVKRGSFDSMDFDTFVAGESKIIYSMLYSAQRENKSEEVNQGMGRLRVLTLMSHWMCKCKNWNLLKGLFENIIEEVETGECSWADDFSSYETMITQAVVNANAPFASQASILAKKPLDTYWCKNYQNNACEQTSPHMAVIRTEDGPVPVQHICAACWGINKKKKEHPENDPACPAKKY